MASFVEHPVYSLLSAEREHPVYSLVSTESEQNEMLKQCGVSTNEIYQEDFLKVAISNRSTKAARISSLRRAPCS